MAHNRIPGQGVGTIAISPAVGEAFVTGTASGLEALEELGVHMETDGDVERTPEGRLNNHHEKAGTDDKAGGVEEICAVSLDEEEVAFEKNATAADKLRDMTKVALYALHVDDDVSLSPWTFRTWFLGLGLSAFSSTLATIYQFKPQGISLSATFLCVISYILGKMLELIPRRGILRYLNPCPFNLKEHAAILIMSSTAAHAAEAIEVIAVQRLWYNTSPSDALCIFLFFSSQCLGYGIAGVLREILVYPTKFVYPVNLPIMTMLESFHRNKIDMRPQLKVFYWAFGLIFIWETLPQYIMPLLTAVSVFCLAKRDSLVFTYLFGGGNGNEGLGFLSMCFDFQYIGSGALYLPPLTQLNIFIGFCLNIVLFSGIYYSNIWRAKDFPFLSQLLFSEQSNNTLYQTYDQLSVLGSDGVVDPTLLEKQGLPWMSASFAAYVLTQNLAITATITHLCLWNWDDLKSAWSFMAPSNLRKLALPETYMFWRPRREYTSEELAKLDPHYRLMMRYPDAPNWWYGMVLLLSAIIGLACIYEAKSGMSWYGFIISTLLSAIFILFTGAQTGLTGFSLPVQPIIQMIGAYLEPGKPVTNMYFTLFGYNSVNQGLLLLGDLKLGQYAKLSPRCLFTMQMVGTLFGAVLNYFIMVSITDAQRSILLSIEGTHIWSGAGLQSFNTQAVTWGGLAKYMYSWGKTYMFVPLGLLFGFFAPLPFYFLHRYFPKWGMNRFNVSIISWHIGWLVTGINSSITSYFIVAYLSQYVLRRYKPDWFLRFNYVLCAGLDGGTQVIVFILSFAVLGASGKAVSFPAYWGNKPTPNLDYCMVDPANG